MCLETHLLAIGSTDYKCEAKNNLLLVFRKTTYTIAHNQTLSMQRDNHCWYHDKDACDA